MFAVVSTDRIELPPGSVVRLPCTWEEYEQLESSRGKSSLPRMKYRNGEILLTAPLPEHGKSASVLANVVEALLDHAQCDYDSFTPITMKLPQQGGIEPDYCFYINNWQSVRGKRRIDWETDPPPDLVIEVDITSYSEVNDYLLFGVPEVWLLKNDRLHIYQLGLQGYVISAESQHFSGIDLQVMVAECLRIAYERNTSAARRYLRANL